MGYNSGITTMGGRAGGGARGGNGMRAASGSLQSLGAAATKAFYTKGVSDYIDGSDSKSAVKAWNNYQSKLDAFKKAYKAANNGAGPAFGDWQGLAAGFGSGDYA